MKKIRLIFMACFMVISLMGQVTERNVLGNEGYWGMEAFEGKGRLGMDEFQIASRTQLQAVPQSAQEINQRRDSIIYEMPDPITGELVIAQKTIFTYDANGYPIGSIHFTSNENFDLIPALMDESIYDTNGQVIQNAYYHWDKNLNQWVGDFKYEMTYNLNGQKNRFTFGYKWDQSVNLWIISDKDEKTYNSNGQITHHLYYTWDKNEGQWVGIGNYEMTYDSNGKITQESTSLWSRTTNQWYLYSKIEKTYDSNGQLTQDIHSFWDQNVSLWVVDTNLKGEFTYDSNGYKTQEIYYTWDKYNRQLVFSEKIESIYNSNGSQTKSIKYKWNLNSKEWDDYSRVDSIFNSNGKLAQTVDSLNIGYNGSMIGLKKSEYSYDSYGNLVSVTNFNGNSGPWVFISKLEYIFDDHGNQTQSIDYSWNNKTSQWISGNTKEFIYDSNGTLKQSIFISMAGSSFIKMTTYYSEIVNSSITNISAVELKPFPNPATGYITFDLEDSAQTAMIELYDMQGKKIISQILASNHRVGVAQLKSGMYFYKLFQAKKIFKGKVRIK